MNWFSGGFGVMIGGALAFQIVNDFQHSGREILIGLGVFVLLLVAIARVTRKPEPVPEPKVQRQAAQPPVFIMPAPPSIYGTPYNGGYTNEQEYVD